MPRDSKQLEGVTLLGNQGTKYVFDYSPHLLEAFENQHQDNDYVVTLDCPEFTSLCPKTGQPDFGRIIINYIPRVKMVESKSLKLYLFSFRNRGDFHVSLCQLWRRRAPGDGACSPAGQHAHRLTRWHATL